MRLKFLRIFKQRIKVFRYVLENHKELLLGIFVLALFVAVVTATVYNSMHIQSTVGVEPKA
jgi:hypothetical protein